MNLGFSLGFPLGFQNSDISNQGYEYSAIWDFVNNLYLGGSPLTFTRASSATYFDSAGVLQTAASDVLRFDYDPVTLAPRGILIEGARTNLITYSDDFANASWLKTGATISSDAITAPDGGGADKITEDTSTGEHGVLGSNVSYTSGTTYCLSAIVKAAERTLIRALLPDAAFGVNCVVVFNLSAGTAVLVTGSASTVYSITAFGGGWWRITLSAAATATVSATSAQLRLATTGTTVSYTGTSGHGLYLWGAQLEAGAFASSLIRTAGASTTRAADVLTTAIGPWFNPAEGTWIVESSRIASVAASSFPRVLLVDDGTSSNFYGILWSTATSLLYNTVVASSSTQVSQGTSGLTQTANNKIAASYLINNFSASVNGGAAQNDTSGTVPTGLTTVRLGGDPARPDTIFGHLRRVSYIPRRVSNAELQRLSL